MGRIEQRGIVNSSARSEQAFVRFLAGDEDEVGPLLESSRPALERHVARAMKSSWLRHYYTSRDIVQTVYVKAIRKLSSFQGQSRGQWEEWLRCISNRVLLDAVRDQRKLRGGAVGPEPDATPWESLDHTASSSSVCHKVAREEACRLMQEVLGLFSKRDRQIIVLRNLQELPWELVAKQVGCSSNAARMRYHREIMPKLTAHLAHLAEGQS